MLKKRVLSFLLATAMATTVLSNPVLIKAEDKVEQSVSGSVLNEGEKIYVVKKGDTLSKIAKSQLGKSSYYTKIFERNKHQLKNASSIRVGQKLIIPNLNPAIKITSTPKPTVVPTIKLTVTPTPKPTATPIPIVTSTPKPTATIVPTLTPTPVIQVVKDISDIVLNKDLVITDVILNNIFPDGYLTKEVVCEQTGRTIVQYFQIEPDWYYGNYIIDVDKETSIILKCENDYEIHYGQNTSFKYMMYKLEIEKDFYKLPVSSVIESLGGGKTINLLIPIGSSEEWNFREYKVRETLLSETKAKCELYNVKDSYTVKYVRKTPMNKYIVTEEILDIFYKTSFEFGDRSNRKTIETENTIKYIFTMNWTYANILLPKTITIEVDKETSGLLSLEFICPSLIYRTGVESIMTFLPIVGGFNSFEEYERVGYENLWEEIENRGLATRVVKSEYKNDTGSSTGGVIAIYIELFEGDSIMYEIEDFIIKESALLNEEDLNPEETKYEYLKYELFVK